MRNLKNSEKGNSVPEEKQEKVEYIPLHWGEIMKKTSDGKYIKVYYYEDEYIKNKDYFKKLCMMKYGNNFSYNETHYYTNNWKIYLYCKEANDGYVVPFYYIDFIIKNEYMWSSTLPYDSNLIDTTKGYPRPKNVYRLKQYVIKTGQYGENIYY
jgi:hypothetical protein